MGLGIAASLMWYMFLSAFNRGSDHYYYGGYNRRYDDDYDYVEKVSLALADFVSNRHNWVIGRTQLISELTSNNPDPLMGLMGYFLCW